MILDTDALSALAEGEPRAVEHLSRVREIVVPVIVLGEYRFGIAHSRRRRQYERWLSELLAVARVLEIGEETTVCYAEVRGELKSAGTPLPANDVWVAALCRQHFLPIMSRDRHFDSVTDPHRLDW